MGDNDDEMYCSGNLYDVTTWYTGPETYCIVKLCDVTNVYLCLDIEPVDLKR